jgi:hypothetical protein
LYSGPAMKDPSGSPPRRRFDQHHTAKAPRIMPINAKTGARYTGLKRTPESDWMFFCLGIAIDTALLVLGGRAVISIIPSEPVVRPEEVVEDETPEEVSLDCVDTEAEELLMG